MTPELQEIIDKMQRLLENGKDPDDETLKKGVKLIKRNKPHRPYRTMKFTGLDKNKPIQQQVLP